MNIGFASTRLASGHKTLDKMTVVAGANRHEINLEIDEIKLMSMRSEDKQVRNTDPLRECILKCANGGPDCTIADDPDEFENAINQLAESRRTDSGKWVSRWKATAQVTDSRNPLSHESVRCQRIMMPVSGLVDITTKPGVNSWHGSFNFGFRDESMMRDELLPHSGSRATTPIWSFTRWSNLEGPHFAFLNGEGSLFYDAKTSRGNCSKRTYF